MKRPVGISVLDGSRAQNMAIVLGKLAMSSKDLCACLETFSFRSPGLRADDLELLCGVLPTDDEKKKLSEYASRVHELRDIEQKVFPLVALARGVQKVKLMKFALSHRETFDNLVARSRLLRAAAEEAKSSKRFRETLGICLKLGNFINHGVEDTREGAIRGFAIESLSTLTTFKTGAVSTMHYLCLKTRSSNPTFLFELKQSLQSLDDARREKTALLKASVDSFQQEATFARQELKHYDVSQLEEEAHELIELMQQEATTLQTCVAEAVALGADVHKYFSVSEKAQANLPPLETFFGHIADFLIKFEQTWMEVERNPGRFALFANVARSRNSFGDPEHGTPNASGKEDSESDSAKKIARRLSVKQRAEQFQSSLRKSGFSTPSARPLQNTQEESAVKQPAEL